MKRRGNPFIEVTIRKLIEHLKAQMVIKSSIHLWKCRFCEFSRVKLSIWEEQLGVITFQIINVFYFIFNFIFHFFHFFIQRQKKGSPSIFASDRANFQNFESHFLNFSFLQCFWILGKNRIKKLKNRFKWIKAYPVQS